jgi:aminoglycoside phosphotransferase (APT) family kinase protein
VSAQQKVVLDADRLSSWVGDRLPGHGTLIITRLTAGHSNLTFTVTRPGTSAAWVLRRPPLGPLLPTAHDVLREATVLRLLEQSGSEVRAPRVALSSGDTSVIGAPFYLMELVPGTVIRGELPPPLADQTHVHELGLDLVDSLAELHSVDVAPFIEAGIGSRSSYLARQVRRWIGQREGIQAAAAAEGASARELPDYDAVRDWLQERLPGLAYQPLAVVHGDFKLDNVIVGPESRTVMAILDWEMATVGDPLADVGYLLATWPGQAEVQALSVLSENANVSGLPSRDTVLDRYTARTGRTLSDVRFYETLALWKLAVLLEVNYHRHLAGFSDDPYNKALEHGVPELLAHARQFCGA